MKRILEQTLRPRPPAPEGRGAQDRPPKSRLVGVGLSLFWSATAFWICMSWLGPPLNRYDQRQVMTVDSPLRALYAHAALMAVAWSIAAATASGIAARRLRPRPGWLATAGAVLGFCLFTAAVLELAIGILAFGSPGLRLHPAPN